MGGISWSCICQYVAPWWQERKYSKHEQGERVVGYVLHQRLPFHLKLVDDEFDGVWTFLRCIFFQYLCLCQPDRMTEGWDSNFFGFFRTISSYKQDWYWTLTLVKVVLFHLSLLVLILRCLQRWDTPPQSGIPWNCVTHKFIESAKNLVVEVDCRVFLSCHNTVVTLQAFHPAAISEA